MMLEWQGPTDKVLTDPLTGDVTACKMLSVFAVLSDGIRYAAAEYFLDDRVPEAEIRKTLTLAMERRQRKIWGA